MGRTSRQTIKQTMKWLANVTVRHARDMRGYCAPIASMGHLQAPHSSSDPQFIVFLLGAADDEGADAAGVGTSGVAMVPPNPSGAPLDPDALWPNGGGDVADMGALT